MKILYALAFALALALIGACGTPQPGQQPELNLAGYPPAFRDGYVDGCSQARSSANSRRNEDRFKNDSMYASGWRDGFDICSDKKHN